MHMTIGKLARAAGVHIETIRFYQRRGLISEPPKPAAGFREYPPEAVQRVRFIKRAQELGLTLDEVAKLLSLGDGGCAETRALARHKLALIEAKIADLQALQKVLTDLVQQCDMDGSSQDCPIIDSITAASAHPDAHIVPGKS